MKQPRLRSLRGAPAARPLLALLGLLLLGGCGFETNRYEFDVSQGPHNSIELTDANWQQEVLNSSEPVLVDFWAPWCGPCVQMSPVVEQLATQFKGQVKVGKLNVDDHDQAGGAYSVEYLPTFLMMANGKEVGRITGSTSKAELLALIEQGRNAQPPRPATP